MAAIKLHGSPFSTATGRVLATLYEKEIDFEFVPVDMSTGEHKKEAFLKLNPFGQVPAFEDGDLQLFESRAIDQYLTYTRPEQGTPLASRDFKQMAIVGVCMEMEAHKFDPLASKLVWELCIKPMLLGMPTDDAVVEENEVKLGTVLDIYEARLCKTKYLAGDFFSLADLHHLPNIHYLLGTKSKHLFDSRPHVSAWVADITARPAWQKVVAMQKK